MNMGLIIGGIAAGYFTALAVQLALGLLITHEGRGLLMSGECMSRLYYVQLALSWFLSAAAAGVVVTMVSQAPGLAVAGILAVVLVLLQIRNAVKMKQQQPLLITVVLCGCITLGTLAGSLVDLQIRWHQQTTNESSQQG